MRKQQSGPLARYLAKTGIKPEEFAELIECTATSVYRYCTGRIPDDQVKRRIALATGYAVTPNDWLGIPKLKDAA